MLFESQAEREALINLMLIARFTDKKLSTAEHDTFTNILRDIDWEDVIKPESFVSEQIRHARDAAMSSASTAHFIQHQCKVFTTQESKQKVLTKIDHVLHSDGLLASEKALYEDIVTILQSE